MSRPNLGRRAFVVSDPDRGEADWVYAETPRQARNAADLEHTDYVRRHVRRAPELDQYMETGGPTKADLLKHGWWWTCHWDGSGPEDGCTLQVNRTQGAAHGDAVYCWKHLAKVLGVDFVPVVERFKAFWADWMGAPIEEGDDGRLDWQYEDLERLAAKVQEYFGITIPVSRPEEEGMNLADTVTLPIDQLVAYIAIQMQTTQAEGAQ